MIVLEHDLASRNNLQGGPDVQAHHDNEYFEVPLDSNRNYVERSSITNQLEDLLEPAKTMKAPAAVRVVLYGLGGAGKTELAARFAERHQKHYRAIFWVYGADASRLKEGFERIGKTINRESSGSHRDLLHDAQTWFAENSGWLLIVDNVDDKDALDALRWQYLKGSMKGHVIVTSRNPSTSVYWNGIEVADMNLSEAISLMNNIVGRSGEGEDAVLARLLSDLGYLPLAIDQASSYIAATGMSTQEYHRWYKIEKARLLNEIPSTLYRYDSRQTVMTTWEISFQRVTQSDPAVSKLLLMMSHFSHDDIPITMIQLKHDSLRYWASNGEWDSLPKDQEWVQSELKSTLHHGLRLREAIRSLRNYSFIRYKQGGESLWIHPLVHYWASHKLKTHPDQQQLTMCSIGLVASSFEKEDRLPPIAIPYGRKDVASVGEERNLRLWPWRQYMKLVPHAHLCLRHVTRLASMPEAMAHLCLSLLQILEYTSTPDDPVVALRLAPEDAHKIIDHVTQFGEAADDYLDFSSTLWRLTRATVCSCLKWAERFSNRCCHCQRAIQGSIRWLEKIMTQPDVSNLTARIKATSLGLLFIIVLDGRHLLDACYDCNVGPEIKVYSSLAAENFWLMNKDAFGFTSPKLRTWFDKPNSTCSHMERYVYNMGRYIRVRSVTTHCTRLTDASARKALAEEVTKTFEVLCGQRSEEYRRSVWYLTTALEEDWGQIRQYLEPLVAHSMDEPTLAWSHERCIIRLLHAYFELGLSSKAQDLSEQVQRSYNNAEKFLRSMQKNRLPAGGKVLQDATTAPPWQIFVRGLLGKTTTVTCRPYTR
ncbi:MAG: hypothetical protein Q9204_003108, partial [Flavoplaca sp. TL-2023a]